MSKLTLRQRYAMAAISGIADTTCLNPNDAASQAFAIADAMILFEEKEKLMKAATFNSIYSEPNNPLGYPDHVWLQMLQNARRVMIADIENDVEEKRVLNISGSKYDLADVDFLIKEIEDRLAARD